MILVTLIGLLTLSARAKPGVQCTPVVPWQKYEEIDFRKVCGADYPNDKHARFDRPIDCFTRHPINELALSIANNVFQCDMWCVYSIKSTLAWIWSPTEHCWVETTNCNDIPAEVEAALEQKERLCPLPREPKRDCTPLRHTRDLNIMNLKEKCPMYHGEYQPTYHIPLSCETGEDDGELSQAIINGAFSKCENWCVYSLKYPAKVAWNWDPNRHCWSTNNGCTAVDAERSYAEKLRASLCEPPCAEPRQVRSLGVQSLQIKCPGYTANHSPQFHHSTICGTNKEDLELHFALANFAFQECKNWCVYSLDRPLDRAWMWNPSGKCWNPSTECVGVEIEKLFALKVSESLCIDPSKERLESIRVQRATPEIEDTGLYGDRETQLEAIYMYQWYLGITALALCTVGIVQFTVLPTPTPGGIEDSPRSYPSDSDREDHADSNRVKGTKPAAASVSAVARTPGATLKRKTGKK